MFCTGTMGELAGVIKLDGRIIGTGEIGPVTRRLSTSFAERTATEGEPVTQAG
jgi:branched-chain amino acid aminotransferase